MPPFVPRKRSHTPEDENTRPTKKRATKPSTSRAKPTLFDSVDSPKVKSVDKAKTEKLLAKLGDDTSSEDESVDFEDVPDVQQDDEEELDWESAIPDGKTDDKEDVEIGDVNISLRDDGSYVEPLVSAATGKKGPSKRERHIRNLTHALHVQALMVHNTVRNSWLNDAHVQKSLLAALPPAVLADIKNWKRSMGKLSKEELEAEKAAAMKRQAKQSKKGRAKKELKGRDWSYSAEHTEIGNVDFSHGDPLLRLLKTLAGYWKKRFTITAPGIRKRGYMQLRKQREELKGWEKDRKAEQYGEYIPDLKAFRELARSHEGSRDVGAQLFVALLRALGLETRMVVSLQPAGFGWSKSEEASTKNVKSEPDLAKKPATQKRAKPLPAPKLREKLTPKQMKKELPSEKPVRKSLRGDQSQPINIDDSESELSSPPAEIEDDSDASLVDITPISKKEPTKKFDRDLAFPIYWAEVLSPATNKYIPVDAVVLKTIGSNDELVATFEPRGSKADKSKQVICYTIGFNADGTAKDVTVRYLKKHQLPGKTKGVRMPIEKVPIYNRKGKVKSYEEYDWFGVLMLKYGKLDKNLTDADRFEEDTDLKPWKPAKEEKVLDKESLAWYKASAEFVLEEHLRREEALLPGSKPVKVFTAGKGDKAKDHQVFLRENVVSCKTVESWHKEGRGLLPAQQPLKYVPIRAVTLQRKREIEDIERETGEKAQQGLYSIEQTDWIIPPPIVNGVIPKNAFNNMDVFVPTMVPAGAAHLPQKGMLKVCKRLGIDYAEAVTGFEFGNKRAVPVIQGVVIAKENAARVKAEWQIDREEIKRKEDVKRTAVALHWWKKMTLGMRIIDRMRAEYANTSTTEDEYNPFVRKAAPVKTTQDAEIADSHDTGGGFMADDDADESMVEAGGFLRDDELDSDQELSTLHEHDGGFLVEDGFEDDHKHSKSVLKDDPRDTPMSLQSMHEDAATMKSVSRTKQTALKQELSDASDTVATAKKASAKRPSKKMKMTPVKSPYFSSQEVDDDEDDDDEHDQAEVVAPRRTTARTRAK